ncbi:MAG: pyridoxamine 5'-phosphate oxidase family protein [Patescibacteria group bacterium]
MDELRVKRAKEIIEDVIYITLATVSKEGNPWNSPVYTAYDNEYNFYWISSPDSQHSKNIEFNHKVFAVIYSSNAKEGTGEGVYMQGKAEVMNDEDKITLALKTFYARKNKETKSAKDFIGVSPRSVYRFTPERVWVNDDIKINGHHVDTRNEVNLN